VEAGTAEDVLSLGDLGLVLGDRSTGIPSHAPPAAVAGPTLLSSAKDVPAYSTGLAPAISQVRGVQSQVGGQALPEPNPPRRSVMLHRKQAPVFAGWVLFGVSALLTAVTQDAAKLELRRAETTP